mmetsp:Transcript_9946/g.31547  ORF Transcript_9946/g.31547 Transcript_9946/m.31547 type:complete len:261 (-) Transcript_9946:1869-2651(-)
MPCSRTPLVRPPASKPSTDMSTATDAMGHKLVTSSKRYRLVFRPARTTGVFATATCTSARQGLTMAGGRGGGDGTVGGDGGVGGPPAGQSHRRCSRPLVSSPTPPRVSVTRRPKVPAPLTFASTPTRDDSGSCGAKVAPAGGQRLARSSSPPSDPSAKEQPNWVSAQLTFCRALDHSTISTGDAAVAASSCACALPTPTMSEPLMRPPDRRPATSSWTDASTMGHRLVNGSNVKSVVSRPAMATGVCGTRRVTSASHGLT